MFAVPGWSVSAADLKTQEDLSKKSAKKRKRDQKEGISKGITEDSSNPGRGHAESSNKRESQSPRKKPKVPLTRDDHERKHRPLLGPKGKGSESNGAPESNGRDAQNKSEQRPGPSEDEHSSSKNAKQQPKSTPLAKVTPSGVLPDDSVQSKLTPLQRAMRQKLMGAHFRHLNESLYTTPSSEARQLFETNPSFFDEYHSGFRRQVSTWPENPVDAYVKELRRRLRAGKPGKRAPQSSLGTKSLLETSPLPRTNRTCRVADLGCGDASLALQVSKFEANSDIEVLSFDLQSKDPSVTKADIANLPLESGSVNVAILCLALMGTNWIEFIEEAYRILHWKGELWVAEIKSRFSKPHKGTGQPKATKKRVSEKVEGQKARQRDEEAEEKRAAAELDGFNNENERTDVSAFLQVLRRRGFTPEGDHSVDLSNKMFVKMKLIKALPATKGKQARQQSGLGPRIQGKSWDIQFEHDSIDSEVEAKVLKPCVYKTR